MQWYLHILSFNNLTAILMFKILKNIQRSSLPHLMYGHEMPFFFFDLDILPTKKGMKINHHL